MTSLKTALFAGVAGVLISSGAAYAQSTGTTDATPPATTSPGTTAPDTVPGTTPGTTTPGTTQSTDPYGNISPEAGFPDDATTPGAQPMTPEQQRQAEEEREQEQQQQEEPGPEAGPEL